MSEITDVVVMLEGWSKDLYDLQSSNAGLSRLINTDQREVLRRAIDEIVLRRAEVSRLQSLVPHPGEGSCEHCGVAPATVVVLCEEGQTTLKGCDECNGDGWVHNQVEGRGACTCMIEAEPFQILQKALEQLAEGNYKGSFFKVEQIAKDALKAVLPMD